MKEDYMRYLINKLIGSERDFPLEYRVFNVTALIGITCSLFAAILNLVIGLGAVAVAVPLIMGSMAIALYLLSMNKGHYFIPAYIALMLLTLILYPALWFFSGGSFGSIPYFIVFQSGLIAVLLGKTKYQPMLIIHLLIIGVLLYIDYTFPQLIVAYASPLSRYLDLGFSLTLISFLTFFMISRIMKEYNSKISELEKLHGELQDTHEKLKVISITDEMTGVFNRRHVMNRLREEIATESENNRVAVVMFDIDHFKKINDSYGHGAGDDVIRTVSQTLKENIGTGDVLGRIGGEEFLILLPGASLANAEQKADDLRRIISDLKWTYSDLTVTISGGVHCKTSTESMDDILEKVDQCLYKAKNDGRNLIRSYGALNGETATTSEKAL